MTPQRTRAALLKIVREECDDAHAMAEELRKNRLAKAAAQLTAAHIWFRVSQRAEQELGLTIPPREPLLVADAHPEEPPP